MIWFSVQLLDLLVNHRLHLFVIFCSYVWLVFLVKFYFARKYKPYVGKVPNITTSAIIIVFREDPDVLRRCLESVIENRPDELLTVIDERDKGRYEALLDTLGVPYTYAPPGKREAIADRVLTSIALRNGFKTVYQSTAKIFTTCPSDFKTFTKMHLRWARSSQRETVKALRWYVKKPFILPFSFITDIITPFFFTAILISAIMNILLHFNPTLIIRGTIYDTFLLGGMILGYIGMNISLGARQIPHLREYKHDIPLLLVWTLFMSFVMVPIRILGFLTMAKQDWMTRARSSSPRMRGLKTSSKNGSFPARTKT